MLCIMYLDLMLILTSTLLSTSSSVSNHKNYFGKEIVFEVAWSNQLLPWWVPDHRFTTRVSSKLAYRWLFQLNLCMSLGSGNTAKISHYTYSILLLQLIIILIPYPCTMPLAAIANWSAFVYRAIFANHVKSYLKYWTPSSRRYGATIDLSMPVRCLLGYLDL